MRKVSSRFVTTTFYWISALALAFSLLLMLPPQAAYAATIIVNTAVDESDGSCSDGDCSLRDAIEVAADGDTITFAGATSIYLNSELTIGKPLTIDGGDYAVTVSGDTGNDGSPDVTVFAIGAGDVTLSHLSIVSGTGYSGGGIRNYGILTVNNSTISGNSATIGGGIYNYYRTLTVNNCTLSNNTAFFNGGGIYNENSTLTVTNSTLSGNSADVNGGGIYNSSSTVVLTHDTFSGNSAASGGGIINDSSGKLHYQNTLIANNSGGDCNNVWGTIDTNLNNLVEDGSCDAVFSGDPSLGPLADNGGGTWTHALLPNSPAIDVVPVSDCPLITDQRGFPRPYPAGGACDIGAYEDDVWPLRLQKSVTPTHDAPYHGLVTYTLSMNNAGGSADSGGRLTDTLPAEVDFVGWIISPTNTTLSGGEIRWQGTLNAGQTLTWSFQARHNGDYRQRVTNDAAFSGNTGGGNRRATFDVACGLHITVQNANDSGPDSLRQAIDNVCPGGVIDFDNDYTIYLDSELSLNRPVMIDGSGHAVVLSGDSGNDGSPNVRALNIGENGIVTLSHLSIINATAYSGGGILNYGTLTIMNSTLSGNSANFYGGSIANYARLTVMNSTLSGNTTIGYGGGIFNSNAALTITNGTLSGNSANYSGGGIYFDGGMLNYQNTLIANNADGDCIFSWGTIGTDLNNLVGNGSCNATPSSDPLLGPLADNGGGTLTHALLPGSPAIDVVPVSDCPLTTDQRGFPRPYPAGGACDIGAYEDTAWALRLHKSVTPTNAVPYHGLVTYTLSLSNLGASVDDSARLTATLPDEVDFAAWIVSPTNTMLSGDEIRWQGTLAAGQALTWSFQARHTGDYEDHVTNTVSFSGDIGQVNRQTTFDVVCGPHIIVQNADDDGAGSLRRAIAGVCPGGMIEFDNDYTIYLNSELILDKRLTIDGSDHSITISGDSGHDGSPNVRVFSITPGNVVTLSHLSIVSGTASEGGGVANYGGLTVIHSVLSGNSADSGGGISNNGGDMTVVSSTLSGNAATYYGGGIYNTGTLVVMNSTLFDNSANDSGGGIQNASGKLTIMNSTLSNNSAAYSGGGINNDFGVLTILNSTLSDNAATYSGGVENDMGALYYQNTLIANSSSGTDCTNVNGGIIGTSHNNLVEDGSCNATLSGDPLLGPLADNGGNTWTHALLSGSPAIDAIPTWGCALATDQRGFSRPYPSGGMCDIGAYEDDVWPLRLQKSVTPTTDVPYHGLVTYTLSLHNTGADADPNVRLTDTLPVEVDFAGWIVSPMNTTLSDDEIRWQGALDAGQILTWSFQARHIGDYGDYVVNTATSLGDTNWDSRDVAFDVICGPYIVVRNANDSGAGSLRRAISDVCSSGVVDFDNDYTIYLDSELAINKPVTINESGRAITVSGDSGNDGSPNVRVFNIGEEGVVTLNHLNIISGTANEGGGIFSYFGTLTVTNSSLSGNSANYSGGGISNYYGPLTINNSTFSGNSVTENGGGVYNSGALDIISSTFSNNIAASGGGIHNQGNLTVVSNTLSGNTAAYYGGGICNYGGMTINSSTLSGNSANESGGGIFGGGTMEVNNSTLSDNSATSGGGIYNRDRLLMTNDTLSGNSATSGGGIYNDTGPLYYQNTLIANSTGGDCNSEYGTIATNLNNLVEDGSCNATLSGDPLLGPLADNGGNTWTHALLSGSPAIDAVPMDNCTLNTDQRGFLRPYPVGGMCDIGAYEDHIWPLRMQKSVTPTVNVPYHGLVTYTLNLYNVGPIANSNARLTDTLPSGVDFAGWIISPTNTTLSSDEITWQGTLDAGQILTWSFQARHTGDYMEHVVNNASFSGDTNGGSRSAAFDVVCGPYAVVHNANDRGAGSLRQTIDDVCSGGVVTFDNDYAIYLNSTLNVNKPVAIDGSGHAITISGDSGNDGSPNVRVFSINTGGGVTLGNLNIVSGTANDGGGIYNSNVLTVVNSTLSGNFAEYGGGIVNENGILTLINSTLSGNSANSYGGGIFNYGSLTVINGTLSNNSAAHGGGLLNLGPLSYQNTLIANNSGGDCYNDEGGAIGTNRHNLVESGSCNAEFYEDPMLGPLVNNGGGTRTHALLPGSPAIDAVPLSDCPLNTDQRGFSRPYPAGGACDIGAFENDSWPLRLQKSVSPATNVPYDGLVTYTLTLNNVGANADPNVRLTDTLPVEVDFAGWIISPTNTTLSEDEITWQGTVDAGQVLTWSFQAQHIGTEKGRVVNEVTTSDDMGKTSQKAAFVVNCSLPHIVVQNANDSGAGSLRQAIEDVCSGGVITFDNDYTIYLDNELFVNKLMTIDGGGRAITISGDSGHDGSPDVRVIFVDTYDAVTLNHLNVVSGTAYTGGGIVSYGSMLTVMNSTISGNSASYYGGGILGDGRLQVINTTISGNSSNYYGGGIYNSATMVITNSTVSGNSALYNGGGIYNYGALRLNNSTLSDNTAGAIGSGIYNNYSTLSYQNTIIANNIYDEDCHNNAGTINTNINNLVEDGSCNAALSGDPLLGPLADNGGDTPTHALLSGSSAIDAVPLSDCPLTTDQRGFLRPYPSGGACDIGAYEFGATLPTYTLTTRVVGNGAVALDPPGGVYTAGTQITLTATPDSGWHFAGWSGDLTTANAVEPLTMDANKVVTATFTQEPVVTHTLTTHIVGNGAVTLDPPGGVYTAGAQITLTATPDSGWLFAGWSGDLNTTNAVEYLTMDANKAVTATFTQEPVVTQTLTKPDVGNGPVHLAPPGDVYTAGTQITLTATPDSGWAFAGWSGDLNTSDAIEHLTMDANKVVTATFTQEPVITHTLTITTTGNGSGVVTPTVGAHTYLSGTLVTLGATPAAGSRFDGWSGAAGCAEGQVTLDADKLCIATFTLVEQRVYLPLVTRHTP